AYALTLLRYIESNPVRAGMVSLPWHYKFSSSRFYALRKKDQLLSPLGTYLAIYKKDKERASIYRGFFKKNREQLNNSNKLWVESLFLGSQAFIEEKLTWLKEEIFQRLRWRKVVFSEQLVGMLPTGFG
ncbi:hypothetical protein ACFL35_19630, partial [Candidatus Riflebacteria bacterium]